MKVEVAVLGPVVSFRGRKATAKRKQRHSTEHDSQSCIKIGSDARRGQVYVSFLCAGGKVTTLLRVCPVMNRNFSEKLLN